MGVAAKAKMTAGLDIADGKDVATALRRAARRIGEWAPKGVHFGWEPSFRNKGKFLATMTKDEARALVRDVLLRGEIDCHPNRRDGCSAEDQFVVVADAGRIIGTRGQRRIRVVIVRDAGGHRVDNAFPVRLR
jgi:hypothetical protein